MMFSLFLPFNSIVLLIITIQCFIATTGINLIHAISESLTCASNSSTFCKFKSCLEALNINANTMLVERSTKSSSKYAKLNYQWNPCCGGKIYPMAYFLPKSTSDVQGVVKCAQSIGPSLRIVAKGGGHSYGKYGFGDSNSVVVDLQAMSEVKINSASRTAKVGPENIIGPLIYKLWSYKDGKFSIPFGECPTVGIGFVLGGGYSDASRLFGMGSDSLLEVHLVNAAGRSLIASQTKNSDLFWALRGGGSGSFGIVTKFKFRLHDAPYRITEGLQYYSVDAFPAIFQAWQDFVSSSPSSKLNGLVRMRPDINLIIVRIIELQTELEFTEVCSKNIERVLNGFPKSYNSAEINQAEYLDYIAAAGSDIVNITSGKELKGLTRRDFYINGSTMRSKSFYTKVILDASAVKVVYELIKVCPKEVWVNLKAMGGAIDLRKPTDSAFVHRNQLYDTEAIYLGSPDEKEMTPALEWLNNFFDTTKSLMNHTQTYQNHVDIGLPDYLQRYFGLNLKRLVQIKRKYDGNNFFYNPQSIPTKYP